MHLNTVPTGFNAFLKNVKKQKSTRIVDQYLHGNIKENRFMTIFISHVTEDACYILSKEAFKFSKKHYST